MRYRHHKIIPYLGNDTATRNSRHKIALNSMLKIACLLIAAVLVSVSFTATTHGSAGSTLEISHDLGTTQVQRNPERVVVFDFGVLETLEVLGVEVVGVPQGSLPQHLAKYGGPEYRNVGSLKEPDFETINDIRPDLIIISGRQSQHYEELSRLAPTIFMGIDTTNYLASFKANVSTLGEIFVIEDAAAEKLAEIDAAIERVKSVTSGKSALMLLVTGGKASTFGPGSRYGLVYDVLGLDPVDANIAESAHGQNISWEFVLVHDPDHLLVIDRDAVVAGGGNQTAKQVVENALVRQTRAFRNGHITYLDPNYWYLSGGGLISFTKMLTDIEEAMQ